MTILSQEILWEPRVKGYFKNLKNEPLSEKLELALDMRCRYFSGVSQSRLNSPGVKKRLGRRISLFHLTALTSSTIYPELSISKRSLDKDMWN